MHFQRGLQDAGQLDQPGRDLVGQALPVPCREVR